jgi:hypothetical protein
VPGGVRPTHLASPGQEVISPALSREVAGPAFNPNSSDQICRLDVENVRSDVIPGRGGATDE